ncbi:nucleoside triphosphate pyrophosphohydrolase [Bacillus sp. 2205SS5-2]|uniref:nucleoside triphosphate pyrophosphohydrolase n=1 Tax=Bacillus sp. 2205SS5-2 TaxID=3109031 RepID=UPI00300584C1
MKNTLTIIGLGAGDIEQLPLGVYRTMLKSENVYLRTKEHPVVSELENEGVKYNSFDAVYEKHDGFEEVYQEIVTTLICEAKKRSIVYAVPGHPLVAERTVQLLLDQKEELQVELFIAGGQSFLDALFTAVKVDPINGFQLLDGTSLNEDEIGTRQAVFIGQVYDSFIASEVKLTLMEKYPYNHDVFIVTAAGSKGESVERVSLYELDHHTKLSNLTSVYVPPLQEFADTYQEFSTLKQIIAKLRAPEGCPWDKEQTHESLKKYLIEEVYELLSAIDEEDIDGMVEELGDVLLQIMLHAQIGTDEGLFTIQDVVKSISSKMVRRHPHVFGDVAVANSEEVVANWIAIKQAEKNTDDHSLLDRVEKGLPSLLRAYDYQKIAAKKGFDWKNAKDAWMKVKEEMKEFQLELEAEDEKKRLQEFGDVLFSLVNVGRLLNIHPEEALAMTNEKFYRRFNYVEEKVNESNKDFSDFSLEELDGFWEETKLK